MSHMSQGSMFIIVHLGAGSKEIQPNRLLKPKHITKKRGSLDDTWMIFGSLHKLIASLTGLDRVCRDTEG